MTEPLSWVALEHEHVERHPDWFWGVGIIALGGAVIALLLGNVMFALFIVVCAVTMSLYALKHPQHVNYQIGDKGVLVDTTIYLYPSLESFCIHEHHDSFRLIVKSQKVFMPYIIIPLDAVPPAEVRKAFAGKLPEVYVPESISEKLLEVLGF